MTASTEDKRRGNADPERFLRVDHLNSDLRGHSVRSGVATLSSQAAKFAITLVSTAVLARLLAPEDFGLIAMVVVLIGFVSNFKDLGLAMATVQRADLTHDQVSTLFWINLGVSGIIGLLFASLSPIVAWFYGEPRVSHITLVLAGTIILAGLTVQHLALLRRQMRFGALALVEMTAVAIGFSVAIIGALSGLGYWALVLAPVVREIVMTIGAWIACGWRPGSPVRRSGARHLLSFGAHLTGSNIANYLMRNVDKILLGRYWGAAPLGLYNTAYQLLLLPVQQISSPLTSVAVPVLSRLQRQLERYRVFYRRGVLLTVTAGMPIVVFLFVDADRAVLTILGARWIDAVPIFRVLSPASFIGTFGIATGWVYVSLGATRRQLAWSLFASLVTTLAFAIGLRWGPIGVGAAFSISLVLLRAPAIIYCFRPTHLRLADLGMALWRPSTASLSAGAVLHFMRTYLPLDLPVAFALTAEFLLYLALYLLIWVILPGGRNTLRDVLRLARDLRRSPGDIEVSLSAEPRR